MDYSGWDIKKALQLLRKSNPPFFEWMQSPIVYKEDRRITDLMRSVMPDYYSPLSCLHHYLHMAQGNCREYLRGEEVWVKKYLYVLRPLLACLWIERDLGIVPTEFGKLVDSIVVNDELRQAIDTLLALKMAGAELDRKPKINVISHFIETELGRLSAVHAKPSASNNPERLNQIFRESLHLAWGTIFATPNSSFNE